MKEFEEILDNTEKSMDSPERLFAFVAMLLLEKPNMKIKDMLALKEFYENNISVANAVNESKKVKKKGKKEKKVT